MNNLSIAFSKDSVTVTGKNCTSISGAYQWFVEFLDMDQEGIESIFDMNKDYLDNTNKFMFSYIVFHELYDDSCPKEDILKSIQEVKGYYYDMACTYLDENPIDQDYKSLTPRERYIWENDTSTTVACNISLDRFTMEPIETYYPKDLKEVCYILFIKMIVDNKTMKRCANCNRFFVKRPGYNNEYCNRLIPGKNKTCKDVGAILKYKAKPDNIRKIFDKAYKTYYARLNRYHKISHDEFNKWVAAAIEKREDTRNGKMSEEEFKEWIDNNM